MKRLKLFWIDHSTKIYWAIGTVILIILSIIGLMTMESFYRNLTLAQLPIQTLMALLNAVVFVYLYQVLLHGGFGKVSKNAYVKPGDIGVTFKDVIGLEVAKKEAMEVVELLKDRSRLKAIGGKIIKGLLMVGPPGTGKTLLAKAIAAESKVPFLSMAGSEFVEVFVGVGASRVRRLFKRARTLASIYGACIVFIDEIDVVGRGRTFSAFGGAEETNSTQNQLLVEMDGLGEKQENVVVIGATNAAEGVLDHALMRPGRFDRHIFIDLPNLQERVDTFRYYLKKVKCDPAVDIGRLARRAVHKSPADINNIVKESALIATRDKRALVTYKDLSQAMERIDLGIAHPLSMTPQEREAVAYHETGHLMVLYQLHPTDDVFKASIIHRGGALGVVYHSPREELHTADKNKLMADIKTSLGGYMGEKVKYGVTSNGVTSDFRNVMAIAHRMVWSMGMGPSGFLGDYEMEVWRGGREINLLSQATLDALNKDVKTIVDVCAADVEKLLKENWNIVERFVQELLQKSELEYDEIHAIFAEFGKARTQVPIEMVHPDDAKYMPPPAGGAPPPPLLP